MLFLISRIKSTTHLFFKKITASSLSCRSIFANFSDDRFKESIECFIRKIGLGMSQYSDALCYLGVYQLFMESKNESTDEYKWLDTMRKNFIKSSNLTELDYTIT